VVVTFRAVGAGIGRTGTYSLKLALERLLGGRCHHMAEVLADRDRQLELWAPALRGERVEWEAVFAGFVAAVDFPAAAFWQEISEAFPDCLVVLSTRPAEAWYRSAASTIFELERDHGSSPFQDVWNEWLGVAAEQFDDRAAMIAAYERHNAAVRASVPADRFLEWTVADGWEPLCECLGVPVPDEVFPATNTTAEFRAQNGLAVAGRDDRLAGNSDLPPLTLPSSDT
jgi:hypothetical protein